MKNHTIIIACDQHEGEEFAAWLNDRGHTAIIGTDTGTWVDGERNSPISDELWDDYCDQ